jgi:protein phosphatase-4 regulatory subunit 3
MLERLTKAKKPDLGTQKGAGGGGMVTRSAKLGDDPPKKLKLKFGLGTSVLASSSPSPTTPSPDSKNGAKDGDTG